MRKEFLFDDYDDGDGPSDEELFALETEDDEDDDWLLDSEIVVRVSDVSEGARTLPELASRLYDYADELLTMVDDEWELVGEIVEGQGVAVRKKHDE